LVIEGFVGNVGQTTHEAAVEIPQVSTRWLAQVRRQRQAQAKGRDDALASQNFPLAAALSSASETPIGTCSAMLICP